MTGPVGITTWLELEGCFLKLMYVHVLLYNKASDISFMVYDWPRPHGWNVGRKHDTEKGTDYQGREREGVGH